MKSVTSLGGLLVLFLAFANGSFAQTPPIVARIEVKNVGPPATSDELVRANIRTKPGDPNLSTSVDDDVRNLYATGFFYNIQVAEKQTSEGLVLTYILQGKPRLTAIQFSGNKKFTDRKLRPKLTSKAGQPLDEHKLFTDAQAIKTMYQKAGYPNTDVKYVLSVDENNGTGTATFEIKESPRIKVEKVEFIGAQAFTEHKLKHVIKTRGHWMFSWLTSGGKLKDEQLQEDRERLAEFYREKGYIDFEIKDLKIENLTPKAMVIRFFIQEGRQYKVGAIKITGNKLFSQDEITRGMRQLHAFKGSKARLGAHGLEMDVGDNFTPKGLANDVAAVEDFYGAKGYIDATQSSGNLRVLKIPNTDTGTMDLEFAIDEGQQIYIEKVEIRGNDKTRDKVIRRELAVTPGEPFNMVRVKLSEARLKDMQYFEKVDTHPEPTDVPNRRNLVIGVEEKNTGNFSLGAGFSSVDSIVGFAEISQGNFDLFKPPTFTGGGQKFRLKASLGTKRQDYEMSFIEPWFLGKKLALGVDLYYRDLNYQSVNNLYDETRAGARFSLTRALWRDSLIGSLSYTIENVGIHLNTATNLPPIPPAISNAVGSAVVSKIGMSIAYDTENSSLLPNKGQRTQLSAEFIGGPFGGDKDYYKLELQSAWYFRGLFEGHVLEVVGRTGVADSLKSNQEVPFYERYYLGGVSSLRGFRYRGISPRDPGFTEPIGGDTYWFGSIEYSVPIIDRLRLAAFYDVGNVMAKPYTFNFSDYDANWGLGMRLNLPIGPLRLDYGIPIRHDKYNSGSGKFQFSVGYKREL